MILLVAAPACGGLAASGGGGKPGEARVERRAMEDVFLLTGELHALRSTDIATPRVEGGQPQIRWLAEDGAAMQQGDAIVEFDNSSVVAGLEERRTRLIQVDIQRESRERECAAERERKQAVLDKAQVEVEKARVDAAIPPELRPSLEWRKAQAALLANEATLEKARLDLEAFDVAARADLDGLRAGGDKARREVRVAEQELAAVSVRAPRSGIFMVGRHWRGDEDRKLQAGDNVWPGMTVASIPDLGEMEVEGRLSEVDHERISAGMEARVILDLRPDRVFEGRVAYVGSVASLRRDRSGFPVVVSLATTDPELMRPGLSARVEVVRARFEDAFVLPRAAVRFDGEAPFVVRVGRKDAAAVDIAACTPLVCAIASGLKEGDRVRLD